jgi:hypothetical protein
LRIKQLHKRSGNCVVTRALLMLLFPPRSLTNCVSWYVVLFVLFFILFVSLGFISCILFSCLMFSCFMFSCLMFSRLLFLSSILLLYSILYLILFLQTLNPLTHPCTICSLCLSTFNETAAPAGAKCPYCTNGHLQPEASSPR